MTDRVKRLWGTLCQSSIVRPAAKRVFLGRANVLYYHVVGDKKPYYTGLYDGCTLDRFIQDIKDLKKVFGFERLETICNHNHAGVRTKKPQLAITFDDGFRLNTPELLEVLDEHEIKVTTFLVTSCVDNRNLMWRNKLCAIDVMAPAPTRLARYNALAAKAGFAPIGCANDLMSATERWPMAMKDEFADELWKSCGMPPLEAFLAEHRPYFTSKDLDEWLSAGHGVGLHTHTHPFCSDLTDAEVDEEIVRPAKELRRRYGLKFLPFSYPFGVRLPAAKERDLLKRGVFDCAFGTGGFAPLGTACLRLERTGVDAMGVGWPVFGKSFITLALPARR